MLGETSIHNNYDMSEHTHNTILVDMLFHLILICTFLFQDVWLNIMRGNYLNAIQRMKGKLCRDIFSGVYSPVQVDVTKNFNRRHFLILIIRKLIQRQF